jgi:hypothetical protein
MEGRALAGVGAKEKNGGVVLSALEVVGDALAGTDGGVGVLVAGQDEDEDRSAREGLAVEEGVEGVGEVGRVRVVGGYWVDHGGQAPGWVVRELSQARTLA